jgi:hypothetical protein
VPQIFHPSANTLSRLTIFCVAVGPLLLLVLTYLLNRSPFQTQVQVIEKQPVPFSHEHHVEGLGIDCRYCHTSVETSAFAGLPPTYTCMSCHSQIWADSPVLKPVRDSLRERKPLVWTRIHDLPDFVYFHHGIHVQKGVACVSCHGQLGRMPMTWKEEPLTMEWCLSCHRNPAPHLRPREAVFLAEWNPPPSESEVTGHGLIEQHHIEVEQLTNCSICHR